MVLADIDTAPENKWVLILCPTDNVGYAEKLNFPDGYPAYFVAQKIDGEWTGPFSDGYATDVPWDYPPTHWAPLPDRDQAR